MRRTVSSIKRRSTSLSCSYGNEAVCNVIAQGGMKVKEESIV